MNDIEIVLGVEGISELENGMRRAENSVGGASKSMGASLKDMASGMALAFGAAAVASVTAFAKASVMEFATFEQSLADLSALTGATGKDLEFLAASAKAMGQDVEGGAAATAKAFELVGSARPELLKDTKALADFTEQAILLSKASGLGVPTAASALTDAVNQMGGSAKDAGRYVDVLAAASQAGAAAIPDVTEALKGFGVAAASANISIEESGAAIETLAAKGIKGAEAGTALRNIFISMSSIKGLPREAQDSFAKTGVNVDLVSDKSKPLIERLTELKKVFNDSVAPLKVFGKENIVAAQSLLENLGTYDGMIESLEKGGIAQEQAATRTDTLAFAFTKLSNQVSNAMIEVGAALAPVVRILANSFQPALNEAKKVVEFMLSPVLELGKLIGDLAKSLGLTADSGSDLSGIISALGGAIKIINIPFRYFLEFVTAIPRAFVWLAEKISEFIQSSPKLMAVVGGISKAFGVVSGVIDSVSDAFARLTAKGATAQDGYNGIVKSLANVAKEMGATSEQTKNFAKNFDASTIAGLSQSDALRKVKEQFALYIKDTATATDGTKGLGGAIEDAGSKAKETTKAIDALGYGFRGMAESYLLKDAFDKLKATEDQAKAAKDLKDEIDDLNFVIEENAKMPELTFGDIPKINGDLERIKNLFKDLGESVRGYMAQMAGDVAFSIGEAIGSGGNIGEVFKKALQEMAVTVPKMVGMALLNEAATVPSPASLPLAVAGLALMGLSGILSGVFKNEQIKKQQQVPTVGGPSGSRPNASSPQGLAQFIDNGQNDLGKQVVDALIGQSLTLQVGDQEMSGYIGRVSRRNLERQGR